MTRVLPDGVTATTGGKFDPSAGLTYFLAGVITDIDRISQPHILIAVNEVSGRRDWDLVDRLCDERNVLLDSGIFSLAMAHARARDVSFGDARGLAPEEIDGFDELWDRYGQLVDRFGERLWGGIELDQGGREHKSRTRGRVETEFGFVPIPVYHPLLDGWDYYDTLASGYDRISVGELVGAPTPVRIRLVWTAAERAQDYPYLWTHLLGVTPSSSIVSVRFRGSCDSSSWVNGVRWVNTWRSWAMLDQFASFPPDMWYGEGDRDRGISVLSNMSQAMQMTVEALAEDTHPWLREVSYTPSEEGTRR